MRGRVTSGPACPVERPDQPCPPNPVHARVDAVDATGHNTASAVTDDAGRYAIGLPPGAYTLRVVIDALFPRCPETQVTVSPGPPATADIICDSGIR